MPDDNDNDKVRLAKFMASAGVGSRRRCEEMIAEGRVTVNGEPVMTPAVNVDPRRDVVKFEGQELKASGENVYVMLNKPVGYTCSAKDEHARQLVYELLPEDFGRLFTVGRLDRETEGLLLLTNDGELAQRLTHPSFQVEKKYMAECEGVFTERAWRAMLDGVEDGGEFLRAKRVTQIRDNGDTFLLEIILTEGKKREIRRLCECVGIPVLRLARIEFAGLRLGTLATGKWRPLDADEVRWLKRNEICKFKKRG